MPIRKNAKKIGIAKAIIVAIPAATPSPPCENPTVAYIGAQRLRNFSRRSLAVESA